MEYMISVCSILSVISITHGKHYLVEIADSGLQKDYINDGNCQYSCDGWPYEKCKHHWFGHSAECIPPFAKPGAMMYSNYPECALVYDGCSRCDDVCSIRQGKKGKDDYVNKGSSVHDNDGNDRNCEYECDGWPYKQCRHKTRFGSATCIRPYPRPGARMLINYPECGGPPKDGCSRCDDFCSIRQGKKGKDDYAKHDY